jgi:hypothetical protein
MESNIFSFESPEENLNILNDIDSSIHASKLFMRRLAENTPQFLLKFRPQGSLDFQNSGHGLEYGRPLGS